MCQEQKYPMRHQDNFNDSLFYGGKDLDTISDFLRMQSGDSVPYAVQYNCGCKALIILCTGHLHDFAPCFQHYNKFRQLSYESGFDISIWPSFASSVI